MPGVEAFGIDPVHFGIVITMAIAIGLITPPLGLDLFAAAGVIDVPIEKMSRAAIPLVVGAMIATLVVIFFPAVVQVFL
jgi:C4-dicarboxylate transporter DctM subunit